ncbi:MAG: MATE family efflux transporter [Lacunisphaera sp.]
MFRIPLDRVRRILHIGLPAAGEHMCYWLALLLVTSFVGRMGAESLSIMSYAMTIQALVILFSLSLGLGTEIVVGRLIGAGDFEAAYRQLLHSLKIALCLCAGGMAIIAFIAPQLIGLFTKDRVIIEGGTLLLAHFRRARTGPGLQHHRHQFAARDRRCALSGAVRRRNACG